MKARWYFILAFGAAGGGCIGIIIASRATELMQATFWISSAILFGAMSITRAINGMEINIINKDEDDDSDWWKRGGE